MGRIHPRSASARRTADHLRAAGRPAASLYGWLGASLGPCGLLGAVACGGASNEAPKQEVPHVAAPDASPDSHRGFDAADQDSSAASQDAGASQDVAAQPEAEAGPTYHLGSPCQPFTNEGVAACQSIGMTCWQDPGAGKAYATCPFACYDVNDPSAHERLRAQCQAMGGDCSNQQPCYRPTDGG